MTFNPDAHECSPGYYRITGIVRVPDPIGPGVHNIARLYHDQQDIRVCWHSTHVDPRIRYGCIVTIKGLLRKSAMPDEEAIPVDRLERVDKPVASLNVFQTIPPEWTSARLTAARAVNLWEALSRPFQHLLNAVLWDGGRLQRFISGPQALYDYPGSNFLNAVRSAEQAEQLTRGLSDVSPAIVIMAALLLHIGRADDYQRRADHYALSERGFWVGGQYTILEWLAVARTKVVVQDNQYLALVHAMIAAQAAPVERHSIEATILAVASKVAQAPLRQPAYFGGE